MASPVTTRRSFAKAGAWSAPMIAATSHIPAYAASISIPEPVLRFGIFAQVAVEDAGQLITRLGHQLRIRRHPLHQWNRYLYHRHRLTWSGRLYPGW